MAGSVARWREELTKMTMGGSMLRRLVDRVARAPLIGVDLGSSDIKVVELARSGEQIVLERCAVAPVNGEGPSDVLKRLVSQVGITRTDAALGVASPEVVVKPFRFPPMPKK